jgi:hypothetical protein
MCCSATVGCTTERAPEPRAPDLRWSNRFQISHISTLQQGLLGPQGTDAAAGTCVRFLAPDQDISVNDSGSVKAPRITDGMRLWISGEWRRQAQTVMQQPSNGTDCCWKACVQFTPGHRCPDSLLCHKPGIWATDSRLWIYWRVLLYLPGLFKMEDENDGICPVCYDEGCELDDTCTAFCCQRPGRNSRTSR